jgi:hypothetical protein
MPSEAIKQICKVERRGSRYYVEWNVERRQGPNRIIDRGLSRDFGSKAEAERWRVEFERVTIDI